MHRRSTPRYEGEGEREDAEDAEEEDEEDEKARKEIISRVQKEKRVEGRLVVTCARAV